MAQLLVDVVIQRVTIIGVSRLCPVSPVRESSAAVIRLRLSVSMVRDGLKPTSERIFGLHGLRSAGV